MEYFFNDKVQNALQSKSNFNESLINIIQFDILEDMLDILSGIALSAASKNVRVLYIRSNPMNAFPTINIHENTDISYYQLEYIKFQYLCDYNEMVRYWSSVHCSNDFASLIIMENFDSAIENFPPDNRNVGFSRLSALLRCSIEFIKSQNGFCKLIVATKRSAEFRNLLPLFYDNFWNITQCSTDEKGRKCLAIKNVWEKYLVSFIKTGDDIIFNEAEFN